MKTQILCRWSWALLSDLDNLFNDHQKTFFHSVSKRFLCLIEIEIKSLCKSSRAELKVWNHYMNCSLTVNISMHRFLTLVLSCARHVELAVVVTQEAAESCFIGAKRFIWYVIYTRPFRGLICACVTSLVITQIKCNKLQTDAIKH